MQIFVAKCTLTFNIAHSYHTIYMDHHYIYTYMLTLASIHSHDANTLHTTHIHLPSPIHIHTQHNIWTHYCHIYIYMIKQYRTLSDIIHIHTVHNISVLAYIIK